MRGAQAGCGAAVEAGTRPGCIGPRGNWGRREREAAGSTWLWCSLPWKMRVEQRTVGRNKGLEPRP